MRKKLISMVCTLAILAVVAVGGLHLYSAQALSEEESNLVFRNALEEVLATENITADYIAVTIEPIYDMNLDQLGFLYLMNYYQEGYQDGFAILINETGTFEVAEFHIEGANPFAGVEGKNVYVGLRTYLVYNDGEFIEPQSGIVLSDEIVAVLAEEALYKGESGEFTVFHDRIYFVNRVENRFLMGGNAMNHPTNASVGTVGHCVPAAALNILEHQARFFPSLVPFEVGQYIFDGLVFMYGLPPQQQVQPLINELAQRMGTTAQGTSVAQFRTGITSYVQARGRNIQLINTMDTNRQLNFNVAQGHLRAGRPLMVFSQGFSLASTSFGEGGEIVNYWVFTAGHGMAAFGYTTITYTFANGTTRTDRFFRVASGTSGRRSSFFNVDRFTTISQVYAVRVF